jgi:hypothetical protein
MFQRLAGTFYERDHLRYSNITIDGNVETGKTYHINQITTNKLLPAVYVGR